MLVWLIFLMILTLPFSSAEVDKRFLCSTFAYLREGDGRAYFYCASVPHGYSSPNTIYYVPREQYETAGRPQSLTGEDAIAYGWAGTHGLYPIKV